MRISFTIALLLLATAAQAQPCPQAPGVYLKTGTTWTELHLTSPSGYRVAGGLKAAMTYGGAHVHSILIFRGATASTETATQLLVWIKTLEDALQAEQERSTRLSYIAYPGGPSGDGTFGHR